MLGRRSEPPTILSIQSHVAFGHVGNDAAVFPMQRQGCEVWPIHTVQFSNHTGYGAWKGQVFDAALIDACVEGIDERGVLGRCDAVLSGYMGNEAIGAAILRAVARVRQKHPAALYCCDPVIGDSGTGVFVKAGLPEFIAAHALPAADILTPNQFELDHLTGAATPTLPAVRAALRKLHAVGPRTILVTSVLTEETPAGSLDLVVSDNVDAWRLRTPRLAIAASGAGDAIAALFLVHFLRGAAPAAALAAAAASIYGVLRATCAAGATELLLVAAQEELIAPSLRFTPEQI